MATTLLASASETALPAYVYAERSPTCARDFVPTATTLTVNCPFSCSLEPPAAMESPDMLVRLMNMFYCIYTTDGRVLNAHNETVNRTIALSKLVNGAYSTPRIAILRDVPPNVLSLNNLGIEKLGSNLTDAAPSADGTTADAVMIYMSLANNSIASVDKADFPVNLRTLILDGNRLEHLQSISAPRLSHLSLSRNPTLPPSFLSTPLALPKVKRLDLESMQWSELPRATVFPSSLLDMYYCTSLPGQERADGAAVVRLAQKPPLAVAAAPPAPLTRRRNAQHNQLSAVYANFSSALEVLCLAGNNVTAFYATNDQFERLKALPQRAAIGAEVTDVCSEASPLLTTRTTNATCVGHLSTRLLWGTYPVCIVDDSFDAFAQPSHGSTSTTLIAVSIALAVVALAILGLCLRRWRRRHQQPAQKWYAARGVRT
ncbi:hypothetical protein ACHHYP_12859 [Achlya hypogyna]|uniref:Uncharacterized protein n=1 Tax=Achlya hypogyna TaxID=1202772 RepID=A0A1V9ZG23_ACHHY|nr:hypothetical protein ACHHYP_12859 [Achlya hypogyna]